MRILDGIKLDFDDVLIAPRRSTLASRQDVTLTRSFKTRNGNEFEGVPIIAANMTTGNFVMADALSKHKIFTAIAKHHNDKWMELAKSCRKDDENKNITLLKQYLKYCFYTIGMCEQDFDNLYYFANELDMFSNHMRGEIKICIDIANGYSQKFANWVQKIRNNFENNIIMAGNVCTTEMTQELVLAGADIVKIGIGPGCFIPETLIKTLKGLKQIKNIKEGEYVLTHTGQYKKIIGLMNRKTDKIISVNGIKSTDNHEYYVINKEDIDKITEKNISKYAFWLEAQSLDKRKHLLIKIK
jgi:GMP reductase